MGNNNKKAIHYPDREAEISAYWNNIYGLLNGPMGTKYNTSSDTLSLLSAHKTNIPLKIQKAFDDNQTAQGSTAAKNTLLETAETDMMRELKRITELDIWEEDDGQTLGIR